MNENGQKLNTQALDDPARPAETEIGLNNSAVTEDADRDTPTLNLSSIGDTENIAEERKSQVKHSSAAEEAEKPNSTSPELLFKDTVSLIESGAMNLDVGIMLLKKAANEGNIDSWIYLGRLYADKSNKFYNPALSFECFLGAAKLGSGTGLYNLGLCYNSGMGCDKDLESAYSCFNRGSEQNDVDCTCALGICREFGIGCDIDYRLAASLYSRAAEQGSPVAICNLGGCYLYGHGLEQDKIRAFELFEKAAQLGSASASCRLGVCYENGEGCEKDDEQAFNHYKAAADKNHAFALYHLALCYDNGIGTEQNFATAFKYYNKAAEAGCSEAMYEAGMMSKSGRGTAKDPSLAYKMFSLAADAGVPNAEYELGNCYLEGSGTIRNRDFAFMRYTGAYQVDDKNANAAYKLGLCKLKGYGTEKDEKAAFEWFCRGAELGSPEAAYMKGECFFFGIGISTEKAVAAMCFEKAIALTDDVERSVPALLALAYSLENGCGIAKDTERAVKLYMQAAESGNPEATYHAGRSIMLSAASNHNRTVNYLDLYKEITQTSANSKTETALARTYILRSARKEYVAAMLSMGIFADEGKGIPKNPTDAEKWYSKVVNAEFENQPTLYDFPERFYENVSMNTEAKIEAQYRLGMIMVKYDPSPQSYILAFEHIASAASLSHEYAAIEVAKIYVHGGDLRSYYDSSFSKEDATFANGQTIPDKATLGEALNKLGDAYFDGKGSLKKNQVNAARCYKIAAEIGNVDACYSYGWCLRHGAGVHENDAEASKWLKLAADKGNVNAAYSYGLCCEEGAGTGIKNKREARSYYRKAASAGHAEAAKRYLALSSDQ